MNQSVDLQTWQRAQAWEKSFWLREQRQLAKHGKNFAWKLLSLVGLMDKYRGDDDNRRFWAPQFNNYEFLPRAVESAIEVGCGPYTNMRVIRESCRIKNLVLSDPLMDTYITFKRTFVREMWKTKECVLDNHPLESLPFGDASFDLAVMVNVLDHVRDARLCMDSLVRILRPGGILVLAQDLSNEQDVRRHPDGLKLGHPITLDEGWFESYLNRFSPIHRKLLPREQSRAPEWHYGTLIFAGKRQS